MTDSDRSHSLLHGDQRVAVLADAQNLYHTAQSLYSRNIDYEALLDEAVGGRDLVRAVAYVVRAESPDEERFFRALVDIGFETRIKRIKTFGDGSKKADWDVGMSLDAVTLADHVDAVVLCTGDGDFSRLCSHLRHEGVRVEVLCFGDSTAEELIEAADSFLDLAEREDDFLL
ncbi:MAG: NYN domain-containing protein [Haloferacaceae archaeon]